jgi:hypothetical protein
VTGEFSLNNKIAESVVRNGTKVSIRGATALYLNQEFMKITNVDELPFPNIGTVRKAETIAKGSGNTSYIKYGLPDDLARKGGFTLLYLEIEGVSKQYEDYINKKVSPQIFHSRLVVVYIRDQEYSRLPRNAEVVFVDYEDPTDINTIFFNGLVNNSVTLNPNTSAYKKKKQNGARNNFASGE